MGQSSDGGWLCGSAALYGYNWNCGGAASHPAWPALSLCHAGPAAQVQAHTGEKLLPTGIWLHAQFLSLSHWVSCVTGPHVCPSLSQSVAASCHWMHFETLLSEGFSSSCSERRQAQVGSQVISALTQGSSLLYCLLFTALMIKTKKPQIIITFLINTQCICFLFLL